MCIALTDEELQLFVFRVNAFVGKRWETVEALLKPNVPVQLSRRCPAVLNGRFSVPPQRLWYM